MLACALAAGALLPGMAVADPAALAPYAIDGPGGIATPSALQMSIARDGSGGLVYLRGGGGDRHVYLSRLTGGTFTAPVQIDAGLSGASSQPVIAAAPAGELLVAFVSQGSLYTVTAPGGSGNAAAAPPGPPTLLATNSSNPAISVNLFGRGYLVYTQADGSGTDVRAARIDSAAWTPLSAALNQTPGDDGGSGAGRPAVATGGDSVGIVAWGEGGHIDVRKLTATTVGATLEQADGALPGCTPGAASLPAVGTQGDSSYADVVFAQSQTCGSPAVTATRVLQRRLRGSAFELLLAIDGITSGTPGAGATSPQIAEGEYGHGLMTAARTDTFGLFASVLGGNGTVASTGQASTSTETSPPAAVPALAGLFSDLIAYEAPSSAGPNELRVRFSQQGTAIGAESVASTPSMGPTDATGGLAAAGDSQGDAAVAWLQGASPGSLSLVVAQLYQPPGGFGPLVATSYSRLRQPTLMWSVPNQLWGALTYRVSVDGQIVGQTQTPSFVVPSALADGPHQWQVTATNVAGQGSTMGPTATVWVDAVAPVAAVFAAHTVQVDRPLQIAVTATDTPPGESSTAAAGLAGGTLDFGDGSSIPTGPVAVTRTSHSFSRPGTYRLTETLEDRAGNVSSASAYVTVEPKPKPKPKPKPPKPKRKHKTKPKHKRGRAVSRG